MFMAMPLTLDPLLAPGIRTRPQRRLGYPQMARAWRVETLVGMVPVDKPSLARRAVEAYEAEHAHRGAESVRIEERHAAIAIQRHRDAVSGAHRLAETLGMTLVELPADASYRCYGDRPLAAFRSRDLPADLLVTSEGNWGFGAGLLGHPLRLLDRHGYRSRWFDSLEDLGRELVRFERDGERFDPMLNP
jgi:hypothetical protein